MTYNRLITENQLDEWVRGNSREAQGKIVELTWRLVAASCSRPTERRFPLADSIGQPGPDGVLNTDFGFDPFVPEGRSFWEIGTGIDAGKKATSDYNGLTTTIPEDIRQNSTFVFLTPLSGRRDWQHTWKKEAQASWLEDRRCRNDWHDIRVIDGSVLVDWLDHFPAVERWLAATMGIPVVNIQTIEQHWDELKSIGYPPNLTPHVFLVNRDKACEKLGEVFSGNIMQLKVDTYFHDQVVDFVSAYVANLVDDTKIDAIGRCLIVSNPDSWNYVSSLAEPHILIPSFNLDEDDSIGTKLLHRAKRNRHAVIFAGMPGGIPHPNRVDIPNPKSYQLKEALEKSGYNAERARILANKSNGNFSTLLRCIQNLSLMPEWAQQEAASDMVIAELLGGWSESFEEDRKRVEQILGNPYGDWIEKIRNIMLRQTSPLTYQDRKWKVITLYEAWYALGSRIFDEHLDRLRDVAITVLSERDPKFDLPKDDHYAANIHGKVLKHSNQIRTGLAESIALLGSHSKALSSCSFGKVEGTARYVVREILVKADWVLWASLDNLLPLLAEAAPEEFLNAVENALNDKLSPFDSVFAQEGSAITGSTYMSGLLWALETLAWDSKYLTRVVIILGGLSRRDPGGNWANRPANSLTTILLPWFPQTCAPLQKRITAVKTLLHEYPEIAWNLLLTLLPRSRQSTSGSHKPMWRELIPDNWSSHVTYQEFWEQTLAYAQIAINATTQNFPRLLELIDRLDDLPDLVRNQLLKHLESDSILSLPQESRLKLWNGLTDIVVKHTKFSDAEWTLKPEVVKEIADIAIKVMPDNPFYRCQRLFSERDFDLFEERGNYQEQRMKLEVHRRKAINEVFETGGIDAILSFAKVVESPFRAGLSFGEIPGNGDGVEFLPELLETKIKSLEQFINGFVWGMFHRKGWEWVNSFNIMSWTNSQKGIFLSRLPFNFDTWKRVMKFLGNDQYEYWSKATVNAYEAEEQLEWAIDKLIQYHRPHLAVRCLNAIINEKRLLNNEQAIRVLQSILQSPETLGQMDTYVICEIIKVLQEDSNTNKDDLLNIEWAFLPILDGHTGNTPVLLERKMAEDPSFFCEIIRTVFKSKKDEDCPIELTEKQKDTSQNAYRLLRLWKIPPGIHDDGTFEEDVLNSWLEKVNEICIESGHLEVAQLMVGHVLIHTPADPDGLWIHHAAAKVLNAKDANIIRDGFKTELFNARGVHFWSAGQEEKEYANRYYSQADAVEHFGYHRLANSLRELAASYERDAEREESRDLLDY